jgi:hypothetical protein
MKAMSVIGTVLLLAGSGIGLETPERMSKWAEEAECIPPSRWEAPESREFTTVQIDTLVSYIRYLYQHKQALILPMSGNFYFFFAYNDNESHVSTVIFDESRFTDPTSWIRQDIHEWTGGGTLRYVSPTAYWDGILWWPQVTFNAAYPTTDWYMMDEGSIGGGIWCNPYDVTGPVYDYYLPLTDVGPGNVVYMGGQARDVADNSHVFKSFDGWNGAMLDPPGEVMIFPSDETYGPDPVYHQGYENSQLLYRNGTVLIAAGGYRTYEYGDPQNSLLVVYKTSDDGGNTWSENVWLDQAVVPDMPGTVPGIEGHYSNSFFDALIEDDGDLHFACVVVEYGCYGNDSYVHGMYDVHQNDGSWTASQICDGTYQITPDSVWDPRTELLGGDSWMHSPSLAEGPDGTLFAAWADMGWYNPAIWLSRSHDGGNTWVPAIRVGSNASFPRLISTTTASFVYVVTMFGSQYDNGPLWCIQVPVDFEYVPVELSSFTADIVADGVQLEWATQSEKENFGFNIDRAVTEQGVYTRLNDQIIPGAGTTSIPQSYSYLDETAEPGTTYWYRLQDVSLAGESEFHGPIEVVVPNTLDLSLDVLGGLGGTELRLTITVGSAGPAALKLYDLSGRLVSEPWEGEASRGTQTVTTEISAALPEGAYVVVLTQGAASASRKVVMTR